MKTIVLYSSKTGYTGKYATWIAKSLDCDIECLKGFNIKNLNAYDTIIYGGGLYAGGINGFKKVSPFLENTKDKNIVLFTTGASSNKGVDESVLINHNVSQQISERVEFFYLRGGFDFTQISFKDKLLMTLFKFTIKRNSKKRELTPDERGMLNAYDMPVDFTKEIHITPLVEYVNGLSKI